MARTRQPTTSLSLSRLVCVSVCLCAFSVAPFPQLAGLTFGESLEAEVPIEEDGESPGEELVVVASGRRCLNRHRNTGLFHKVSKPLRRFASKGIRPRAIVGHQLTNGLRAPLVI